MAQMKRPAAAGTARGAESALPGGEREQHTSTDCGGHADDELTMLDCALDWARRDFRVFPLHPNSKQPVWAGWTESATTDPDRIKAIWAERPYNIGCLTNGLICIDVDCKDGKDGFISLLDLGIDLDTLTVRTPSNGLHVYFEGQSVANSSGKIGDGLDIRSYHGYVLAPGSIINGRRYELATDAPVRPIDPIFHATLDRPRENTAPVIDVELDDPGAIEHARGWLEQHPGAIEGQGGDAYTYRTAAKLKDFGLSEDTSFDLLAKWNQRCAPQWDEADLRTKVTNAYSYGTSPPGIASPQHLFAGVEIPADRNHSARPWFYRRDDWRGSVEWLYNDLLPTAGVCIMAGASNSGKTFVALDLAESLSIRRPFFGTVPEQLGSTLILAGEAYGSMKMRLQALREDVAVATTYVGGLAAPGAWRALCDALKAQADTMLELFGKPVRLIILDTLSSSGILTDENNNAEVATVMKAFGELSQEVKALFLVLHHPPKSGDGERGAGAIRNNADYVITIRREGTSAVREIEMTKSRDGENRAFGTFTLVPVVIGQDTKGREIRTMTVSAGEPRIGMQKRTSRNVTLLVNCFEAVLPTEPMLIQDRVAAPREDVRLEWASRQPPERGKSSVSHGFSNAIDGSEFEEITLNDVRYLVRPQTLRQPLSFMSPSRVGDMTDNHSAVVPDNQMTTPDNLTT